VAGVGIFGSAVLAVALVGRWPDVLPWAVALLGGQYAASLLLRGGGIDALAPLYAASLLVTAELGYWALEVKPILGGRLFVVRRLAALLLLGLGTAAVGATILAVSEGGAGSGLMLQLLGLLAAAGTVGLLAWLALRSRPN
jgi:hypothetical protein